MRSFARSFAAELAPRYIRVNAISPGTIDTPIFGKVGLSPEQLAGMMKDMTTRIPLGRVGHADEIAAAVLYLAVDATFMTGGEMIAGGGMGYV